MSKGEPDQELKKAFMELQGKMQETNQKLRIADVQVESLKKQIVHAQLTDKEIQEALPADEQEIISVAEWEAECAAENERLHSAEQEPVFPREKRAGGMGGGRGGMGGFRGRGGSMRGRGMGRPGPYNRRPPMGDRFGPPPGPPPAAPMRNDYYDDYKHRDRQPLPPPRSGLDRHPPMPREPAYRDPYDRYDSYDRMPPPPMGRRTPPPMDRSPSPMGYDRRDNSYGDMYGSRAERDTWWQRDMFPPHGRSSPRRSPPRRYSDPLRDMPPRRF